MKAPAILTNRKVVKAFTRIFMATLAVIILSCDEHPFDPTQPLWGNYYPTTIGSQWTYVTKYVCTPDETTICEDTLLVTGGGDPYFGDDGFKPLSAPFGTFKFVKVEKGEYFGAGYYRPPYKFLDTNLGVNGQWTDESIYVKHVFTITEVNGTRVVNDVNFRHVIGVLEVYYHMESADTWTEASRTYHYYAKGVGEIYSFHPAASAFDRDVETYLADYHVAQ